MVSLLERCLHFSDVLRRSSIAAHNHCLAEPLPHLSLSLRPVLPWFQAFFTQYLSKLSSTVNSLRGSCGLGTRAGGGGASHGEDWAYLQVAFALIQCCGELSSSVHTYICNLGFVSKLGMGAQLYVSTPTNVTSLFC